MNSGGATEAAGAVQPWTLRGLLTRHTMATLGMAAVIAVMLAVTLVPALSSSGAAVSDATSCSQWGSANEHQQAAYSRLYVREHGPLRGGQSSPSSVISAINNGCTRAFGNDTADTVTVAQAIAGNS